MKLILKIFSIGIIVTAISIAALVILVFLTGKQVPLNWSEKYTFHYKYGGSMTVLDVQTQKNIDTCTANQGTWSAVRRQIGGDLIFCTLPGETKCDLTLLRNSNFVPYQPCSFDSK